MPRILVTRAPHQASALAEALRARGLEPILIPTIEIAPPDSWCALDAALACLRSYHWVLFTSANAVEAFATRCRQLNLAAAPQRTAAIGAATARALVGLGITPDLVPPQAIAESLADALTPYALQPDGSPTRMLWCKAQQARPVLADRLQQAGVDLTAVAVYQNLVPPDSLMSIRALFTPGHYPDAITFTSSSSVQNLLALLEAAGLALPPSVLRISIGPVTSATLTASGYPPHHEAPQPTVDALARTVAETQSPE